jgi:hypothetical protein
MSITSLTPCGAFERSAKYYDTLYARRDYSRDIQHALHFYRGPNPSLLIDWGCGTGEHLVRWRDMAWVGLGVDPSLEMVRIAKSKRVDARTGSIGYTNLVGIPQAPLQTCLFAAFSYACGDRVTDPSAILRAVKLHASPAGTFVFDVVNYAAVASNLWPSHVRLFEGGEVRFLRKFDLCTSIIDTTANYCTAADGEFEEKHTLRAFTPREITDHLDAAGFDVLSIFDPESPEREPPRPDSFYFMVAAKVRG